MSLRSYIQDRPMPLVWAWKLTEKVLLLMRPLFARSVGMERSSRIVKLPEELIKVRCSIARIAPSASCTIRA